MKVSMHQPNYIPYLWLFEKIKKSDLFIFSEQDQFSRWDWHDRNFVRDRQNKIDLKIPCTLKWKYVPIEEVEFDNRILAKHRKTIEHIYKNAWHYKDAEWLLDYIYSYEWNNLAEFNIRAIKKICEYLWITTKIITEKELWYKKELLKNDEIIELCRLVWADEYLSWLWWKWYIDEWKYEDAWIKVEFMEDVQYVYRQMYKDSFIPNLSVVDYVCCSSKYETVKNE